MLDITHPTQTKYYINGKLRAKRIQDHCLIPLTPSEYEKLKESDKQNIKVRKELDRMECQCCGAKGVRLHVHHIDGIGIGKYGKNANNKLSNLITLCPKCHGRIHNPRYELSEIIRRHSIGETYQSIADSYGVSRQRIHQLIKKSNY